MAVKDKGDQTKMSVSLLWVAQANVAGVWRRSWASKRSERVIGGEVEVIVYLERM